jgi:hypothetical protein
MNDFKEVSHTDKGEDKTKYIIIFIIHNLLLLNAYYANK